jgi:M6 family metalloprotease-like protein
MKSLPNFLCVPRIQINPVLLTVLAVLLPGFLSALAPAGRVSAQIPEPEPETPAGAPLSITGAKPWVWLLCKYSDDASEPFNVAYFQTMETDLNSYFQEASYNLANINGSLVVSHWYNLPHPKSYYVYDNDSDGSDEFDYGRLATDCTGVSEADVYFPNYYGIIMNVNGGITYAGLSANPYLTLDGVYKRWNTTFINGSNSGISMQIGVTSHEMYHGFGLDHSGVRDPVSWAMTSGNQWDPVGRGACGFGNCTPSHPPAPQKNFLGWIDSTKKTTPVFSGQIFTLEALAQPQTGNPLMVTIPIGPGHYYTLEARRQAGYDTKIPGAAVLIHEVRPVDNDGTVGILSPPGASYPSGSGSMWLAGDTFTDSAHNISVAVLAATATGFQVQVTFPAHPVFLPMLAK